MQSKCLLIMELRFDATLYYELGNEDSDAAIFFIDRMQCDRFNNDSWRPYQMFTRAAGSPSLV